MLESRTRRNNLLYFKDYDQNNIIRILKIPEIIELESIVIEEAIKNDMLLKTLGFDNVLINK